MRVCLDTNVFIAIKNKENDSQHCERILDAIEDKEIEGVISTITIAETLVGFYWNKEEKEAEHFLVQILQNYHVLPVDIEVSEKAARLRAQQGIKLPDAVIMATTIITDADYLITKDDALKKKIGIKSLTPQEFASKYLK
ncbi:MAG: PIN domain-containing protein [Candidatus Freyarchaeum deiterrae]